VSATDLSGEDYRIEPVWLAREAIRTILDHRRRALILGWAPWALVFAADLAAAAVAGGGTVAGAVAEALLRALALFLFGAIVALRWQRYVLLNERQPAPLLSAHLQGFLAAALKLSLVGLGVALVIVLILELVPLPIAAPLAAVGGVALLAAAVRVCLVFPAAAEGRALPFRASWDGLAGNAVRLVGCVVLVAAPFAVLRFLVDQVALVTPSPLWIVLDALGAAIALAGVAAVAIVLADVYRNLSSHFAGAASWYDIYPPHSPSA